MYICNCKQPLFEVYQEEIIHTHHINHLDSIGENCKHRVVEIMRIADVEKIGEISIYHDLQHCEI